MGFREENINSYNEWIEKQENAKNFMKSKTGNKILIEVAAQHPLIDGLYPNEEFSKRLDFAIELYNKEIQNGKYVEFYIPGSLHQHNGISDKISLSSAGRQYLITKGIPENIIRSDEINKKYMGKLGVYNSADECFVASQYFKDEDFSRIYCVASPAQIYRKTLFYIEFGVYPLNYSVPTENSYHNYVNEIFWALPTVLLEDSTWQGKNSKYAVNTRQERNPNYNENDFEK